MIYKGDSSDTQKLLSLPETGMGYQLVEARIYGRTSKEKFIVYNSELFVDLDTKFSSYKNQILQKSFSAVLNEAKTLSIDTGTISLLSKREISPLTKSIFAQTKMLSESEKRNKHRYSGGVGATDSPKQKANGRDTFVRLSVYEDDHRIDFINKRLKEGAFTTTEKDYLDCVRYNDDPVDRYALPYEDGEIVNWAFYVRPKEGDIFQQGIVQPALERQGGGIEAYFEYGTSNSTYLEKRTYGR